MKIRIGTRGSKLALWQAEYVAQTLERGGMQTEIVIIETKPTASTRKGSYAFFWKDD